MSPKKIHETSRLGAFIIEKASELSISHIIDLGAGQGYLSHFLSSTANLKVTAIEGKDHNSSQSQKRAEKINKALKKCGDFETICKIITSENFDQITEEPCILIGLHTCGDLAANSLKLFIKENAIRGVINVGCCYQHLTEFADGEKVQEYLSRIGQSEGSRSLDQTLVNNSELTGFPLSNYVKEKFAGFFLGKLTRSLCIGEPGAKGLKNAEINFKKLEYRAGFQAFLHDFYPDFAKVFALGNKIRKFSNFAEYTLTALARMNLNCTMTEIEINAYYNARFKSLEKKASILWVLRSVLSGPIENLILLDRILYLKELGMATQVFTIFDKKISPRNTVICAFKN